MNQRLDFYTASPDAFKAMLALEGAVGKLGLEKNLLELIKMRSSQLNGCAFCLDMHATDARNLGETERRLYTLSAWRDTPFFTDRERAALAWTEALTLIAKRHPSDAEYAALSEQFSEKERVDLSLAINTINSWNRLAIGFGKMPAA